MLESKNTVGGERKKNDLEALRTIMATLGTVAPLSCVVRIGKKGDLPRPLRAKKWQC